MLDFVKFIPKSDGLTVRKNGKKMGGAEMRVGGNISYSTICLSIGGVKAHSIIDLPYAFLNQGHSLRRTENTHPQDQYIEG